MGARRIRREHGQSMVEFALVAQIFLLLCFLIYQGGVAWFDKLNLEQGTREAARTAAVGRSLGQAGMTSAAIAAIQRSASGLDSSYVASHTTVTSQDDPDSPNGSAWGLNDLVTVTSSYPFSIGVFGISISGTLTSSTTQRIE